MKYFCKLSNLFLVLALLVGLLGLAQPAQASAPLMADLWVTNGEVYATLLSGSTLYIGGTFSYVGPPTGRFAALDATGAPDRAFPPVNGIVYAIVPDDVGGWYVGGTFTAVGGHPRKNLAHLKADKTLDFAWNPNPDGPVRVLAVAPPTLGTVPPTSGVSGSTIYVGGGFTTIGGQSRNLIAALDASTGLATAWNPHANNIVYALGVSGSTIYAGGNFNSIGGQTRNNIAALDASTGLATDWNPNADSTVFALGVSGSTIYAGGDFITIGGQTRSRIAALDANTGLATIWKPSADNTVRALGVSGSTIYAGGSFTSIDGQPRNFIAALDASTGSATAWDPNANSTVYALAVSGSTIYVGGGFTTIGGQFRNRIAALDASTGSATTWDPNASAYVYALAAVPPTSGVSGSTVGAGGWFFSIGGQTRNNIAALDTSTGLATAWNPNANGWVTTLVIAPPISGAESPTSGMSGSTIYVGGEFTTIGGQSRNAIAALDAATGNATTWNPGANSIVYALAVASPTSGAESPSLEMNDSTIYVGGNFTSIGGQSRNFIAALDTSTNNATAWNPNANNTVRALAVSGSTIYTGGDFTSIGGQPRGRIAALDASANNATGWNPNADGAVRALVVAPPTSGMSGSTIYAGGDFFSIGGQPRSRIAALDASTGSATAWNPHASKSPYLSSVNALAVAPATSALSGSTIYAGGDFTSIGGQPRGRIAALDASTGSATAWNPYAGNTVYALTVAPPTSGGNGSTIYAGGRFETIDGRPNTFITGLRDGAATCQSAGSGGSWRASNWSNCGNAIPGDGDTVEMGHAITLYNSLAANDLTINAGGELNLPLGSNLTVEDSLTNNGRLTQTLAVPAATTFLNIKNAAGSASKYFGVTLTPGGDMGNTTVTVRGNQNCATIPNVGLVQRCFEISPTTVQNATARFYYTNAELNSQTYNLLKLWHQSFGWLQVGAPYSYSATCEAGQQDCWLEAHNVSTYSPFVLSGPVYPITFLPLLQK